jgi:sugar phosphate isomerase/epimerase
MTNGINSFAEEYAPDFIEVGLCASATEAAMVKAAGCDYIEAGVRNLLVPAEEESVFKARLKIVREQGLESPACNGFLPRTLKSVGPDHDLNQLLSYAEVAFERAQIAGVEHIIYGSGGSRFIPENFSRATAKDQFVNVLRHMAPIAQKYGVTLCLEPLRSQETNFLNTMIEGAEVCDLVNHQHVGLVCDYYHVTQEGRGVADVRKASKYIRTLHIAENENRQPPGTAGDDFRPFFKTLKEAGFHGRCSIESRWTDKAVQAPVAVQTLRLQIAEIAKA